VLTILAQYAERLQALHTAIELTINGLAHALEHTVLHLGHMEITRQLWEQNPLSS